jgi:hypothetical protein
MVIDNIAQQQKTDVPNTEFTSHRNGLNTSGTAITLQSYTSAVGPQYIYTLHMILNQQPLLSQTAVIGLYNRGVLFSLKRTNTIFKYLLDETLASKI